MAGSHIDGLFQTPFLGPDGTISRPWQKWLREIESKTRADISPTGIIGSAKLNANISSNYSNNATVDSIDNFLGAVIRVYGPGGVGTSWHQAVGGVIGPEIPGTELQADHSTQYFVWWDGKHYQISTSALDSFQDGIIYAGKVTTVAAGGGGGLSGGGTAHYQSGGIQR